MVPVDRSMFTCGSHCCDPQTIESGCRGSTVRCFRRDAAGNAAAGYSTLHRNNPAVSGRDGAGGAVLFGYDPSDGDCLYDTDNGPDLQRYGGSNHCGQGGIVRTNGYAGNGHSTVHRFNAHGRGYSAIATGCGLILIVCLFLVFPCKAETELLENGIQDVISGLDFSGLEDIRLEFENEQPLSVKETVQRLALGENLSPEGAVENLFLLFVRQVSKLGNLAMSIMIPVIGAGFVSSLSIDQRSANTIGRSICFLIVLIPVILCVLNELEHVKRTIIFTTERMDRILPLLLTLLTAVGGSASSAFLHPVVVAASGSMVYLAREVILRLVMCTCVVTTVNHLSDKAHLTRLSRLLRSAVCWLLGVSFTVFLGTMSVQGVCSASFDGVAIRAAKYAIDNFVPVVGGMFSDTMDTIVGCTLVVKNALGVTAMLVLAGAMLFPLVRTFAVAAVMRICAALLEPVAQSSTIDAIEDFSGMMVLFLITMLCVCTMYFLLIVQFLLVGNLTVMLR